MLVALYASLFRIEKLDMTRPAQRLLTLSLSILFAVALALIAFQENLGKIATKEALILTGRAAFFVFLIPFFASPLRALFKTKFSALLIRWRRNAGIAYGGIMGVHLLILAWYFIISTSQPVDDDMLYIGGMGLLLVMGMLITSFDGPTKFLGRKNWKILHKSGFYICSLIYFYDFVLEPIELGTSIDYALFAAITLAAMALRTIVMLKPKPTANQITT